MDFWTETSWFAINTRPGEEETARKSLQSLELETFLPRVRRPHSHKRVAVQMIRPMFPNYFFARFEAARFFYLIRYSRGVRSVVGTREYPVPVEESVIAELQNRVDDEGCLRLNEPSWRRGQPVRVEHGPLTGWEGVFEADLDDRRRVVILLETIHQARMVVDRGCLEAAV
jgi:transcriptional antiterminator RfaH